MTQTRSSDAREHREEDRRLEREDEVLRVRRPKSGHRRQRQPPGQKEHRAGRSRSRRGTGRPGTMSTVSPSPTWSGDGRAQHNKREGAGTPRL